MNPNRETVWTPPETHRCAELRPGSPANGLSRRIIPNFGRFSKTFILFTALFFLVSIRHSGFATPPLLWRRALGGEVQTYPAQGANGNIYFIAADRALHSINAETGSSNWKFRPGGRLRDMLLVSLEGTVYIENEHNEIFAVSPRGRKRWSFKLASPRRLWPAIGPSGQLALIDGKARISIISRRGELMARMENLPQTLTHPIYDSAGRLWLALEGGKIVLLNRKGESQASISVSYRVTTLALDVSGALWVGGGNGAVECYSLDNPARRLQRNFSVRMPAGVEAIFPAENGNNTAVLKRGRVVNFNWKTKEMLEYQIEAPNGLPVSISDGSILYSPLSGGVVVGDPRSPGEPVLSSVRFSPPLVSREGYVISGGDDWIVYAWRGGKVSRGWTQFRGHTLRQGSLTHPAWIWSREEARKDTQFLIRERMARSENIREPMKLLEELESHPNDQDRIRKMPWVDFLFQDLMSTTMDKSGKVKKNHPQAHVTVRLRAYSLIARDENFRMREELIRQLANEQDPAVISAGMEALGRIGVDWDGASARLLSEKVKIPTESDEVLVLDMATALVRIVKYNGGFTDEAGIRIFRDIMSRRLSPENRRKMDKLIAELKKLT